MDQERTEDQNTDFETGMESASSSATSTSKLLGRGLDIGTANIAAAVQTEEGGVEVAVERNAFLDIKADVYSKNMLTKLKVPYVVHNGNLVVLGQSAFELANIFSRETRRPMSDGLISPSDVDALPMIQLIIEKVLGEPAERGENCYFSVPAESIDADNNVVYHQGLFEGLLKKMGYSAKPINEAHALVFAELADQDFTGIGLSFGGGMVNACVSYKTIPALQFSVARGGDWIDKNVAQVLGIKASKATSLKESGMDIRDPKSREEEAVSIYFRNLIHYLMENIQVRFQSGQDMPTFPEPIDIVCSGGTSLIGGFIEVFRDEFEKLDFPIPIRKIFRAEEALNSVAKGCLVAAAIGE
jgi:actin-like ATPase involved in cell morphogenesis